MRANAIAPRARTAMTADVFGEAPELAEGEIDPLSPEHVVTWCGSWPRRRREGVNGQLFIVYGPTVTLVAAPTAEQQFTRGIRRLGARRADRRRCTNYFADRDPEREFLGDGPDGSERLTVSGCQQSGER